MIKLTKINGEEIMLNDEQMESIYFMPESKIMMMNREFYIVKEDGDEIVNRIVEYKRRCLDVGYLKEGRPTNEGE